MLRLAVWSTSFPLLRPVRGTPSLVVQNTSRGSRLNLALVGDARKSAGSRQHAEQRQLRAGSPSTAVVDHQISVAGERSS